MQDFKKLAVWEKSNTLTVEVYRITLLFPKEEVYGLTSQIRRASVSIPSNIAEGCGRDGNAELSHFLHISLGSAKELEYQVLLANELKYLNDSDYENLNNRVVEVRRMLISLIKKLKA